MITYWSQVEPDDLIVEYGTDRQRYPLKRTIEIFIIVSIQSTLGHIGGDDRKGKFTLVDPITGRIQVRYQWLSALKNRYMNRTEVFRDGEKLTVRKERKRKRCNST